MPSNLPPPPPFMWACQACAEMLVDLSDAFALTNRHWSCDSALRLQMKLADHLAREHPSEVPPAHADEDCETCAFYRKQLDRENFDDLWAEHRARWLFLAPEIARLL
jgi:hypothetical protein